MRSIRSAQIAFVPLVILFAGCAASPVGTGSDDDLARSTSQELIGNAFGTGGWTIHPDDGLPTDAVSLSTIAHRKRYYHGLRSGLVLAPGSECAAGWSPAQPNYCHPGGPWAYGYDAVLGLDANDTPILVDWNGGVAPNNWLEADFTGRGHGERFEFDPDADHSQLQLFDATTGQHTWVTSNGQVPKIDDSWQLEDVVTAGYGDFNGDGAIDWIGWNKSVSADTAWRDHEFGVITVDTSLTPHLYRQAFNGQLSGSWLHTAVDAPLAIGNFLGGKKDVVLIRNGWGWAMLADDPTGDGFEDRIRSPVLLSYGTQVGAQELAPSTKVKMLGDVDGDGADDLALWDSARPGVVDIAKVSTDVNVTWTSTSTGLPRLVPEVSYVFSSIATLQAGSTIDAFTLAPSADGSLPLLGADLDGDGHSELVYVGPSGFLSAKWSAADARFHTFRASMAGDRIGGFPLWGKWIGGWVVGAQDAALSTVRRVDGKDAIWIASPTGVGLFVLADSGIMTAPWITGYTPEPAYVTPKTWTYCCTTGERAGQTLTFTATTPQDDRAKIACDGNTVTNGECGPVHDYPFCCWFNTENTAPVTYYSWVVRSTLDFTPVQRQVADRCVSGLGGELTTGDCSPANEPKHTSTYCCEPAMDWSLKPFQVTILSTKESADSTAQARCGNNGKAVAGACPKPMLAAGCAASKPIDIRCCKSLCTTVMACSTYVDTATKYTDDTCKWQKGECDQDCWPAILQ